MLSESINEEKTIFHHRGRACWNYIRTFEDPPQVFAVSAPKHVKKQAGDLMKKGPVENFSRYQGDISPSFPLLKHFISERAPHVTAACSHMDSSEDSICEDSQDIMLPPVSPVPQSPSLPVSPVPQPEPILTPI